MNTPPHSSQKLLGFSAPSALCLLLILALTGVTFLSSRAFASGTSASDSFTRTVTGGWGAADAGGTYTVTGSSADFSVNGSQGVMLLSGTGSVNQRLARLDSISATNVDEIVRVMLTTLPNTSAWDALYLIGRHVSAGNEYRARARVDTTGGVHLQASVISASVETFLGSEVTVAGLVVPAGTFFDVHFQLGGTNPTTLQIRAWPDGSAEPSTWNYSVNDSSARMQAAGSVGLVSRAGSNAPLNYVYDDFVVTNTDGVAATATPTTAVLPTNTPTTAPLPTNTPTTAPLATDTPTSAPLATDTPTTDPSLPTSTPTSAPVATDTPTSAPPPTSTPTSLPATDTPTSAPPPTNTPTLALATATSTSTPVGAWSLTFVPQADSYVSGSSSTSNFGTSTTLKVDASPILNTYIRFAPTNLYGASITRARLLLYMGTTASATMQTLVVSDNSWGETTITYSNAPAMGSALASVSPVTRNIWVTLDVSSYVTAAGTYSFGVITPGSKSISFSSRETGSYAPQLILDLLGGTPPTATPTPSPTPTFTPTNTPLPTSTPTATSLASPTPTPSSSDPVIVGAGDIACGSTSTGGACQQQSTVNLILKINPAAVLPLGDNQYEQGSLSDFTSFYGPSWGAVKPITHPSVGNHEYGTTGAQGYFDYFDGVGNQTGPAGDRSKGYYSYNIGSWHLIALNADCSQIGGCGSGSAEETWLRSDLAANTQQCIMGYTHFPMFSSGQQPHNAGVNTLFQDLYNAHAAIFLAGHDHDYERFYAQNASGALDPHGVAQFVVGTGGRNLTSLSSTGLVANSAVFNSTTFGVIKFTLHASSYDWSFVPAASTSSFKNGTFTESGTAACP